MNEYSGRRSSHQIFWAGRLFTATLALILYAVVFAVTTDAHEERPIAEDAMSQVAFDQKLNEQVPLDLVFRDAHGQPVRLGRHFTDQPVILVPVYFDCPRLCPLVLEGVVRSLRALRFAVGKDLRVVAFSIDPREQPAQAEKKQQETISRYGSNRGAEGWHFLTGDKDSIEVLSRSIGFRYLKQDAREPYAHPSGIVVLTPSGRVSKYFYGFDFAPRDLKLGLIEAAQRRIGSPIDQLLLLCYEYDPATGKYGLVILNSLRLSGLATVMALGAFVVIMLRRERPDNRERKKKA